MELLDTDVLIDVQRGHPPALACFSALTSRPGVPGFVVMEHYKAVPGLTVAEPYTR